MLSSGDVAHAPRNGKTSANLVRNNQETYSFFLRMDASVLVF